MHRGFTDSDLEIIIPSLRRFPNLRTLSLSGTGATDAGLKQLYGFEKLKYVSLRKTQVTDAGIAELKRALPRVAVEE